MMHSRLTATAFASLLTVVLGSCSDPKTSTPAPPPVGTPSPSPTGNRPSVLSFLVTPANQTAPGPVTLSWKVTGATSLQIAGVGSVGPLDAGSATVNVTGDTTFALTATNATGKSTAHATATLNAAPFSYRVDATVKAFENSVSGFGAARPVTAVRDAAGITSDFVADELIVAPGSQAELDAFTARTGAKVLDEYTDGGERSVLVHLDPSAASLDRFAADAAALGVPGANVFASDGGARLMALALHERLGGLRVSADFVDQPQTWLHQTAEGGSVTGETDAFQQPEYNNTVSKPQMVQAWQFVAAHGLNSPSRRVRLAVIDGGFWLNPDGTSMKDANGQGDFAPLPIQADFIGEGGNASGANPADCGNGNACPWHGNGSASVAGGFLNNGAFAAGTGGQVSDLMLLRSDLGNYSVKHALDWSAAQRADVINMSFGGSCNWFCRRGKDWAGYYDAFDRVHDAGIVMVAAAGNGGDDQTGDDVDDETYQPCVIGGVICVGALGGDTAGSPPVYTNGAQSYSNYGGPVSVWAPTDIVAMPDGSSINKPVKFVYHTGTSAAAPYVAGVAAMMKAMNPALGPDQIGDMLRNTAWTDSPDSRVTRYLNAFAAVKAAANNQLPPDRFEPDNTADRAALLGAGQYDDLNIDSVSDIWDYYRFTTSGPTLATITQSAPAGLGSFSLGSLSKAQGCGDATLVSRSALGPQAVYRLPSGSFVFPTVGRGQPLPYDLTLALAAAPVDRDKYEGVTGNDTPALQTDLGMGGSINATLHTASDVDFYKVYSNGSSTGAYFNLVTKARVLGSDVPLTIRAYDDKGGLLGTSTTSADCSKQAELTLPQGDITIQVSGAAPGAYSMSFGPNISAVLRYENVQVIDIVPGHPIEIDLRELSQVVVLNNIGQFGVKAFNLHGSDVHMTLLDPQGQTLASGQPQDFQDGPGEAISLSSALASGQVIVQFDRTAPTPADLPGDLSVVPVTLNLTSGAVN